MEGLKASKVRKVSPVVVNDVALAPNAFGLPSHKTCPGETPFCVACYATRAEFRTQVAETMEHNYRLLLEAGTVDRMETLLCSMVERSVVEMRWLEVGELTFRWHWDGDFFSVEYAEAVARTIRRFPQVQHWAYTRSFTDEVNVLPVLEGLPRTARSSPQNRDM